MLEANAVNLALLFTAIVLFLWWLIVWVSKPVTSIKFDAVELTTLYGNQRIIESTKLQSPSGDKKLSTGLNDFFITVTEGVIRYHNHGEAGLLNPILRSSEDVLFFRLQIRVVGERIVKFEQTNLSKPNAKLLWSKA